MLHLHVVGLGTGKCRWKQHPLPYRESTELYVRYTPMISDSNKAGSNPPPCHPFFLIVKGTEVEISYFSQVSVHELNI